jgi:hypothetical protein
MTNWPGLASLPALASRAGYARKSLQLPFATNATPTELDAPEIIWGTGSPEGLVLGAVGDLYIQTDNGNAIAVWSKVIGNGTAVGWFRTAASSWNDARLFGALADSASDNSPATQAAVNALPTFGGIVLLPAGAGAYMFGATVTAPTDRRVVIAGSSGHVTNQAGGTFGGTVIRRLTGQSGPMFSQTTASATPSHGLHVLDFVLDGNNLSNDLLVLSHVHRVLLARLTFYNTNGHGLHTTMMFNSVVEDCSWIECGSTTGPTYGWLADSDATSGCVTVFVTQPYFECGRGTYFKTVDASGTHPNSQFTWLGGRMEFSGNQPATTPGVPFMDLNNLQDSCIIGTVFINGLSNGATHIKLTNCNTIELDTIHKIGSATDALNPQYLVHVNGVAGIRIRGTYTRGGGNAGAQIRVETTSSDVTISPENTYITPINVPVQWGSTPGSLERAGTGWTGLQSTTAQALGAGTSLDGPARGCSIERILTGGSNTVIAAGNKGDQFVIIHQGSTVPVEFNPTDATSRVYKAQDATIYPGEVGVFFWDSGLALWVKAKSHRHKGIQSPAFAASFTPLPLDGEIIEVGALTANITINDVSANHKRKGMTVGFRFLQDGVGGRAVAWNAVWKQAWSDAGNTAGKQSTIWFYCTDGTNFVQLGGQSLYF